MTTSIDPALLTRLSGEFTSLGARMNVLGRDLDLLRDQVLVDIGAPRAAGPDAPAHPTEGAPGAEHPATRIPTAWRPAAPTGEPGRPDESTSPGASPAFPGDGSSVAGTRSAQGAGSAEQVPPVGDADSAAWSRAGDVGSVESQRRTGDEGSGERFRPAGSSYVTGADVTVGGAAQVGRPVDAGPPTGPWGEAVRPPGRTAGAPDFAAYGHAVHGVPGSASAVPPGVVNPNVPPPAGWPSPAGAAGVQGTAPHGASAWNPNDRWGPAARMPYGQTPGWAPPPPPPVRRPPGDATPWWQREGVISRLLAVAGVGVTLVGVVMLLVLAAQAGIFGPVPRVLSGAAFSLALVGAGARVFGRAGGRVGGVALAATGFAGLYLDVVAVTALYGWLHPGLGLAVAFGVAAFGVALAVRWNSQPLAILVVAGVAVLTPVTSSGQLALAFLIVLQIACLPVHSIRDWPLLHVVRTLPAVLGALALIVTGVIDEPAWGQIPQLVIAVIAIALIGLVGTISAVRSRPADVTASVSLALAVAPILVLPALVGRGTEIAVLGATAAVALLLAAHHLVPSLRTALRIPAHTVVVAAVTGALALLEMCFAVTDANTAPVALLLVALGFLAVAGQARAVLPAVIGLVFAAFGTAGFFVRATPDILTTESLARENLDVTTILAAVALLAVIGMSLWGLRRRVRAGDAAPTGTSAAGGSTGAPQVANAPAPHGFPAAPSPSGASEESALWIVASVIGLYAVTAATVALGVMSGAVNGFVLGHCAATILWMVAATGALFYGLRNLSRAPGVAKVALGSGLVVTGAALAKLFLFDLSTLDGLVRAVAFLVVGVLLLVAGTRYARAFAEAGASRRGRDDAATR